MKYSFLLVLMYVSLFVQGQTLTPQLLSSGGDDVTAGGAQLSWSVGEVAVTTESAGSHILTQGFHQSGLTMTEITEKFNDALKVQVFPNPVHDEFTIETPVKALNFSLLDFTGKFLQRGKVSAGKTTVNLSGYPEGTYLLKVNTDNSFRTFKIIKH